MNNECVVRGRLQLFAPVRSKNQENRVPKQKLLVIGSENVLFGKETQLKFIGFDSTYPEKRGKITIEWSAKLECSNW